MITKPMLAGKAPADLDDVNYPVLASAKLDGIRCLMRGGKALTRTFKPIPNDHIRNWLEANVPDGLDGELMPMDPAVPFKEFSGHVRRKTGSPAFVYRVFDFVGEFVDGTSDLDTPFSERFLSLETWEEMHATYLDHVEVVDHVFVNNAEALRYLHAELCGQGYEGTMIRDPQGPYKCGRSTTKKGELLKVKDFADEEAVITDVFELMHNDNEADVDAFGRTKRSSHKEFKRGSGTLGGFRCEFADGTAFSVGTGFNAKDRADLWAIQDTLIGKTVKIKHQPDPGGRTEGTAPRFPVWLGFRDPITDV